MMAQHLTNHHWVSASQKEAVISAERKYILDLQVRKYGLLTALWQEETGRHLKSSKCLVYQGADFAFCHCTDRTDSKYRLFVINYLCKGSNFTIKNWSRKSLENLSKTKVSASYEPVQDTYMLLYM